MPKFSYDGTIVLSSNVKDLDASVAWFQEKLGFEVTFKVPEAGWAELPTPTPGVTIGLAVSDEPPTRGGIVPVFGVEDIEAARAELEGNGVRFEGDTIELPGMVRLATFADPDGNAYMLAQSLARG